MIIIGIDPGYATFGVALLYLEPSAVTPSWAWIRDIQSWVIPPGAKRSDEQWAREQDNQRRTDLVHDHLVEYLRQQLPEYTPGTPVVVLAEGWVGKPFARNDVTTYWRGRADQALRSAIHKFAGDDALMVWVSPSIVSQWSNISGKLLRGQDAKKQDHLDVLTYCEVSAPLYDEARRDRFRFDLLHPGRHKAIKLPSMKPAPASAQIHCADALALACVGLYAVGPVEALAGRPLNQVRGCDWVRERLDDLKQRQHTASRP